MIGRSKQSHKTVHSVQHDLDERKFCVVFIKTTPKMSVGWDSLPLLPLRCILEHLSFEDALSAMSVCRHWRNAMIVYEGHRELLNLRAKHADRNLFLALLFKKNVRRLHIRVDCSGPQLDKFFNTVLPEFFDSVNLKEILFIGPSFSQHNHTLPPAKIKRIVTECLVFKHSHCLTKFAMLGCVLDVANENDRFNMKDQMECYSLPLTWSNQPSPADNILSSSNAGHMPFSNIQHISVNYSMLSTESLETLSALPLLSLLSAHITGRARALPHIDWDLLAHTYTNGLDVALNIIEFPARRFDEVIANVLVEGLTLVSLKVFFCKTLHVGLIDHLVRHYKRSLREVVWADSPRHPYMHQRGTRFITHTHTRGPRMNAYNINPFIMLCWQCVNLRRLVVHGYWIWHYDFLGLVRLRRGLQQLEVSAIYDRRQRSVGDLRLPPTSAIRVFSTDLPCTLNDKFIKEVNSYVSFPWAPLQWSRLHPALSPRASATHRAHYVLTELAHGEDAL